MRALFLVILAAGGAYFFITSKTVAGTVCSEPTRVEALLDAVVTGSRQSGVFIEPTSSDVISENYNHNLGKYTCRVRINYIYSSFMNSQKQEKKDTVTYHLEELENGLYRLFWQGVSFGDID